MINTTYQLCYSAPSLFRLANLRLAQAAARRGWGERAEAVPLNR